MKIKISSEPISASKGLTKANAYFQRRGKEQASMNVVSTSEVLAFLCELHPQIESSESSSKP